MKNKRVFVDYEQILEEFDRFGNELCGCQGFCLVKGNQIRKIYFDPFIVRHDFTVYKSSKIAFPLNYLYDSKNRESEEAVGEIMKYFPKKSITWSLAEDVEIDKLIKHYYEIIMEIRKYFEMNMHDLCTPNILYDKQTGFSIIDTTKWIINEKDNSQINQERINRSLSNVIIDDILGITPINITSLNLYQNLKKYGQLGLDLYKVLFSSIMDDEHHLIELLEMYCKIFENGDLGPIQTLNGIKNYTKKLKKG